MGMLLPLAGVGVEKVVCNSTLLILLSYISLNIHALCIVGGQGEEGDTEEK